MKKILSACLFLGASQVNAAMYNDKEVMQQCQQISGKLYQMAREETGQRCANYELNASYQLKSAAGNITTKSYDSALLDTTRAFKLVEAARFQKNPPCQKQNKLDSIFENIRQIALYLNEKW